MAAAAGAGAGDAAAADVAAADAAAAAVADTEARFREAKEAATNAKDAFDAASDALREANERVRAAEAAVAELAGLRYLFMHDGENLCILRRADGARFPIRCAGPKNARDMVRVHFKSTTGEAHPLATAIGHWKPALGGASVDYDQMVEGVWYWPTK